MSDSTENFRAERCYQINHSPSLREAIEAKYGQIWNTKELMSEFEVISFLAPYVTVRRKSDNKRGSMEFQHYPRFYYKFVPDEKE